MKFSDLPLSQPIQQMLEQRHLEEATEIQAQAIPALLEAKDLIGLSQTGTGKTLAFVLPILENIDPESNDVQAIILSPTRELAQQTKQEVQTCSQFLPYIRSIAVYGGSDIRQQIFALKRRPNIIIGTPGRVLDHLKRHTLKLNNIKYFVLDEADEMFNMGFRNDIIEIIKQTPRERQTLLFSATMNNEVLGISKEYMKNPIQIKVGQQNTTLSSTKQTYFLVPKDKKKKALHALLREIERGRTLIFCNTKAMVGGIQSYLEKMGFRVSVLHGDMPQSQRSQVMRDYKAGKVEILITTDVSARGIDVNDIIHVINFDLPQNLEYYVHRIGRTGRAGKVGNAWTILNSGEQERNLKEIQKKTNSKIELGHLQLENISEIEQQHSYDEKTEPAIRTRTSRYGGDRGESSHSRPFKDGYRNKSSNSNDRRSPRTSSFGRFKRENTTTETQEGTEKSFNSESQEYSTRSKPKRDEYAPFKTTRTDKQRRKMFDNPTSAGEPKRSFKNREYKSFSGRSSGVKQEWKGSEAHEGADKPFRERKPFGRKPFSRDGATETSFGDREPRTTENKFGDKPRSFGKKPFGRKPFNKEGETGSSDKPRSFGRKPFNKDGAKSFGRKPFNKEGSTERTYASKDAGTDKKFSDRKPRTYVRKPRPTVDKE